ncbi:MAG: tRNA preQ1(34) S-adenosylmethionine ribosyltransferase-isomerase QueA [Myxococcota bacterium]|nr:tRNA preQ1(34) S-adenosylmethionine ribosyltransferase-isomerase QueA [Myxococcota bacterium]
MRVDLFQYELPAELIAQRPAESRELARLLYLPPRGAAPEHRQVSELPQLLPAGALVVVNDTRVVPARLVGRKHDTGGQVEVFLVGRTGIRELEIAPGDVRRVDVWKALGKGGKRLRFGADIDVGPELVVRLLGRTEDDGLLEVALWTRSREPVDVAVRAFGRVPLPPYIKREPEAHDAERYQTVYARHDGAVAAPTAGLHLTNAILGQLAVRGCDIASITLHVGIGTFQPVTVDDLDLHTMHVERFAVPQSTADAIARARARGAPVIAVGTTTVRALESAADPERPGCVLAMSGQTQLLVQPGYRWRVVNALMTNFHLPRSTLLALVCALGGAEQVLEAYRIAVRERYRFFSYGDAMLLWRRD